MLSFKKDDFSNRVLTLVLVYRKQPMNMQKLFPMLLYLVATSSKYITAGTSIIFF